MVAEIKSAPPSREENQRRQLRRPPERRVAIWGPLLVVLVLAMMLIGGIWRHIQQHRAQQQFAQQTGNTTVEVIEAKRDAKPHSLLLPGNITAIMETTLYARADGFVGKWYVDIGDNVKAGQLLAELETPELDQQLAAARETAKQSQANFEVAKVTAQRWQELAQKQVVAKQDNDERQGTFKASAATLASNQADVARLEQLQGFKKIVAPFDGRITSRKIDVGSLVSQGSGTTGTVLYTLAQIDPLRIFVYVPQSDSPLVTTGLSTKLVVAEYANRDFDGKVTRTAGALDPTSRTMLTEVQVPNHDGVLFAGMYAQVKFTLSDKGAPILIPSDVFVFRPDGPQVAIVTKDNKIHWQKIEVGRDFGTHMEVLKGLDEGTKVVNNPTDDLTEGLVVQPQEAKAKPQGDGQKGSE